MKIVQSIAILALSTVASAKSFKGRRTQVVLTEPDEIFDDGYAGKKGYAGTGKKGYVDECVTGKKGSYTSGKKGGGGKGAGKGGGSIIIPDYGDSCVICDKQNKNKPTSLVLQYVADGANSAFQPAGKATCREGDYPSPARIEVNGDVIDVVDGDLIEIFPDGAETEFKIIPTGQAVFEDDIECYIHTSCSVPIVVGDQIGPFLIEGDEECTPPEEDDECCPKCSVCDTGRPDELILKYHSAGVNSVYQDESKASCRAGLYPTSTSITVEGQTIRVEDGKEFTITPEFNGFSAHTDFYFEDSSLNCDIHTSCSAPLILGDQIGPFEVIGDEDCKKTDECDPSCEVCDRCIEADVVIDPVTGETTIEVTFNYSDLNEVDWKQAENTCDIRDPNYDDGVCYVHTTPLPSDWIGFYPCDVKLDEPLAYAQEPDVWAYTCYDDNCSRFPDESAVTEGTLVFRDSTLPAFATQGIYSTIAGVEEAGGGCYVVVLNRIDGFSEPPYYNICEGNEFMIPDKSG